MSGSVPIDPLDQMPSDAASSRPSCTAQHRDRLIRRRGISLGSIHWAASLNRSTIAGICIAVLSKSVKSTVKSGAIGARWARLAPRSTKVGHYSSAVAL
jgi:hypothetical protein